jgi:elongation factor Ts
LGLVQVAADTNVEFVSTDDVDEAFKARELEVELQKEDLQSKPDNIRPKIAQGRVDKAIGKKCLMEQDFIKNPDISVAEHVKAVIAKIGENIKVRRFERYNLGEGIEKKSEDFAAQVAAQMGQ